MIVKLLIEHHLEFLSLKGGCRRSSESTLVKMSNCWKSHATAHVYYTFNVISYDRPREKRGEYLSKVVFISIIRVFAATGGVVDPHTMVHTGMIKLSVLVKSWEKINENH